MEIKKGDRVRCLEELEGIYKKDELLFVDSVDVEKVYLSLNTGGILGSIKENINDRFELVLDKTVTLPEYYNNKNGSLYKVATERGWNSYLFDVVKRLERGGKKDPIKQEIEKSIGVLQLWLKEQCND